MLARPPRSAPYADVSTSGNPAARANAKEPPMNSDQIKGTAKDIAGKAQRKLGEAIGSTEQQIKGAATQAEGKVQKAVGDTREALKDAGKNKA